jgi:hypothetical protein
LVVFFISLVVIFDELPINALRTTVAYTFLTVTSINLPLDLLIGGQWMFVAGIFFFAFAECIGWIPPEVGILPHKEGWVNRLFQGVCGVIFFLLFLVSLYEYYRMSDYTQCVLMVDKGCLVNTGALVSIVSQFNTILALAGVLSSFGFINGMMALAALVLICCTWACLVLKQVFSFISATTTDFETIVMGGAAPHARDEVEQTMLPYGSVYGAARPLGEHSEEDGQPRILVDGRPREGTALSTRSDSASARTRFWKGVQQSWDAEEHSS